MNEVRTSATSCFLTLTYAEVPKDGSLCIKHWQKFAKRLRKKKGSLRFYMVGEYGDLRKRPHFHALVFGIDFRDDMIAVREEVYGQAYVSEELDKIWKAGRWKPEDGLPGSCELGDVTMKSAQYCAGYLKNKVYGEVEQARIYGRVDPDTGECFQVRPEFQTVSTRPAIGKRYLEKYWDDIWATDSIVIDGMELPTPRYYRKELRKRDPERADFLAEARVLKAVSSRDQGEKRRRTIEEVWKLREVEAERSLD